MSNEIEALVIDVSPCNLACRMCPRGGVNGFVNGKKGLMTPHLFERIAQKFIDEKVSINSLYVGNWGEPNLNPFLAEIIEIANKRLSPKNIVINTNLTTLKTPERLLLSGISLISVSLSGFTQKVYSINHKGGNVKKVLDNVLQLARIKKLNRLKKPILRLTFQQYVYNQNDEQLIKNFCKENDINFCPRRMFICGVEENVKFHAEKDKLTDFYNQFIDLEKEIGRMRTINPKKCQLKNEQIVVDLDGQLYRCCGVYDEKNFMGSFFDYKILDIPTIQSDICKTCGATPMSWR
jgi:MoaA/NifB/PqqE/SkfB family radical SAM enzyme